MQEHATRERIAGRGAHAGRVHLSRRRSARPATHPPVVYPRRQPPAKYISSSSYLSNSMSCADCGVQKIELPPKHLEGDKPATIHGAAGVTTEDDHDPSQQVAGASGSLFRASTPHEEKIRHKKPHEEQPNSNKSIPPPLAACPSWNSVFLLQRDNVRCMDEQLAVRLLLPGLLIGLAVVALILPVLLLLLMVLVMVVRVRQLTGGTGAADLVVELAERLCGEHADVAVL
ncbi:Os04g0542400 [Oryza sativa Japonica Group]|uniref:Os04g0542400 protein n=3 Tax=Oryza TaxID=4527 RepID=A0A0N7KJF9_ORYSJ|nr:Os04g0542400 [Oryza sativa Japonica Group]